MSMAHHRPPFRCGIGPRWNRSGKGDGATLEHDLFRCSKLLFWKHLFIALLVKINFVFLSNYGTGTMWTKA